ncbi:MAG: ABC-three component system protein [Butyrivibrio hungatei]|nr:ABC-three component system protein [Butyrivibrio hungatei]
MELCPGTFLTVLKYCKANSTRQKKLGAAVFNALQPGFYSEDDDSGISAAFRGNRNIGSFIQLNYEEMSPAEVAVRVKDDVLPLLDRNKWNDVICAVKAIIEASGIDDDTEIEMVNHFSCSQILGKQEFVFSEFLAGVLIYVSRYADNLHKESIVKQITADYINDAVSKRPENHFVESYSLDCLDSLGNVINDTEAMNLIVKAGGNCVVCGKPLDKTNASRVETPDGTPFIVCNGCIGNIINASQSQTEEYKKIQQQLETNVKGRYRMSSNHLGEDVRTVIQAISKLDFSTLTPLRMDPLTVSQKVSDVQLRRDILHDVNDCYGDVDEIIKSEAASGTLNATAFGKVVKRMYEDREESASESDVYNMLVELIYEQTGRINREACHIVVSYFVQRCEVFG